MTETRAAHVEAEAGPPYVLYTLLYTVLHVGCMIVRTQYLERRNLERVLLATKCNLSARTEDARCRAEAGNSILISALFGRF